LALVGDVQEVLHVALFFFSVAYVCNVAVGSCKRCDYLREEETKRIENVIRAFEIGIDSGLIQERNLKRPGDISWGLHLGSLTNLILVFSFIVHNIERVANDGSTGGMCSEADAILGTVQSFQFAIIFHAMQRIMIITNGHSQAL